MIETSRLVIVRFAEAHLTERYVSWLNDPEVVRHSDQRLRTHTVDSCREYLRSFEGTPNRFWALIARDETIGHVGTMTAYIDEHHGVADLGILIGERYVWGRGYGTEAWIAVSEQLLSEGVRKLSAGTSARNAAMINIMKRSGMREDGRRVRQLLVDGEEVDVVHAARFREDKHSPHA